MEEHWPGECGWRDTGHQQGRPWGGGKGYGTRLLLAGASVTARRTEEGGPLLGVPSPASAPPCLPQGPSLRPTAFQLCDLGQAQRALCVCAKDLMQTTVDFCLLLLLISKETSL